MGNMRVCEIEGRIRGFEYETELGFMFIGEWVHGHDFRYQKEEIKFPYNVNFPKEIDLSKIRDKKFKLTIEIIEDDEQEKKQESSD